MPNLTRKNFPITCTEVKRTWNEGEKLVILTLSELNAYRLENHFGIVHFNFSLVLVGLQPYRLQC